MTGIPPCPTDARSAGLLARLLRDRAGNTLAMVAAALFPLIGLIGGGVDIGRGYLSQSRLQQACDAGVLAARKRLGTEAAVSGEIPEDAALSGHRFFNLNFQDGAYGTDERTFEMTLEEDFSITGRATVDVPTTLMAVFGQEEMAVNVECQAQLNMANTDIMMVLDVTGSMAQTNPGDSTTRMEALKSTVRDFHSQLTAAAPATTRLRFGFVPYSTNVNVGGLLADAWVNTSWHYQSRELETASKETTRTYDRNWVYKSGSVAATIAVDSYAATYHAATAGYSYIDANERVVTVPASPARYTCDRATPASTFTRVDRKIDTQTEPFVGPPSGIRKIETFERTEDKTYNWTGRIGSTCYIYSQTYNVYVRTYERVTDPHLTTTSQWNYDEFTRDVSAWRTEGNGCIEERATYEIDDYANVDLARALDLNLDLVPTSDASTKWSPMYPQWSFARAMRYNLTGNFHKPGKKTTEDYINPNVIGLAACPAAARKLATITSSELNTYLASLQPTGATYHDIGMIWGGRLLSPTGLFASENADVSSTRPSTRHLIFLTDGATEPRDLSYSSYGIEPLDQRRWTQSSSRSLTETVENRFAFACEQVKKKNVSVWVISFGTEANPVMQTCAGADRYFVAEDAAELQATFATIAKRMGELRVTR